MTIAIILCRCYGIGMNKRNTTITTIELTEKDKTSIVALQRHLEALNPAYKVPKRAVISWARYGEVFAYDEETGVFSLDNPG